MYFTVIKAQKGEAPSVHHESTVFWPLNNLQYAYHTLVKIKVQLKEVFCNAG